MTRRGSLVYYLAAVVCGCLFLSVALGLTPTRRGQSVLSFFPLYVLALVCAWFSMVLFGFLLRRLTAIGRYARTWQWVLLGALLAAALFWSNLAWQRYGPWPIGEDSGYLWLLVSGPDFVATTYSQAAATMMCLLVGATTAWVLFQVHRAFEPRTGASATPVGASAGEESK